MSQAAEQTILPFLEEKRTGIWPAQWLRAATAQGVLHAEEDGIDLKAAKHKVRESKRKRDRFTWEMFHRRINDPDNFDLVINTDRLTGTAVAADMIIAMVRALDLDRPVVAD